MIRFIVIVFAMLGAAYALGRLFPTLPVAFVAGGFAVTWIMLGSVAVGGVAYKVTK